MLFAWRKWLGREFNHSSPPDEKVEDGCNITSTLSLCLRTGGKDKCALIICLYREIYMQFREKK